MTVKEDIELLQKYLAIYGKHYTYDCACEYCTKLRKGFNEWSKTQRKKWCEHISMSGGGMWCYNGFDLVTWNFCPKCGVAKPE